LGQIDLVFIVLHSVSAGLYLSYLINKLRKKKAKTEVDAIAVLCFILNLFRVGFRVTTRYQSIYDIQTTSLEVLQNDVRVAMILEHFFSLLGSLALKGVLLGMVAAVSKADGSEFYSPVTIRGRKVDPAKTLKLIRIFVILLNACWYTCWIILGVGRSMEDYVFFRRAGYITWGFVSSCISAPVIAFFGRRLLFMLDQKFTAENKLSGMETSTMHGTVVSAKAASKTGSNDELSTSLSQNGSNVPNIKRNKPQWRKKVNNLKYALWGRKDSRRMLCGLHFHWNLFFFICMVQ
jgi:hypothetical protein